ncbi:MAG: gamma carbonic anhydrase family protein [Planctomycetes bacterium]|nr:gamma carbonic anhydrase family protein [Planctomycetota bacterium]
MARGSTESFENEALFLRHADWYHAANAVIVGDVEIGAGASLWYGTILRGDDAKITVGQRVNLQDLTMVHADPGVPLVIEDDVTVGHRAMLHCRRIGTGSLIGMGAILLEQVEIGPGSLVGADAVVPPPTIIPPNSMVRGVPGRVVRETTPEERAGILASVAKYAENAVDFHRRYGAPR